MSKNIPAGEFKAKCLALLDEVHDAHTEIVVTKRGKPVARVVPLQEEPKKPEAYFGQMAGTVHIHCSDEELFSTGVEWNVMKDELPREDPMHPDYFKRRRGRK